MPRDLPQHEPEKRSERTYKEIEARSKKFPNSKRPGPPMPEHPGAPRTIDVIRQFVSEQLTDRINAASLREPGEQERIKATHAARGDLAAYFNDWKSALGYRFDQSIRKQAELKHYTNLDFEVQFRELLDCLERGDRIGGFTDWLDRWNVVLRSTDPDPDQFKEIIEALKTGMNYQENIIGKFRTLLYEQFYEALKKNPPENLIEMEMELEEYAKLEFKRTWERIEVDEIYRDILELPHLLNAIALEVYTQSLRLYDSAKEGLTKSDAALNVLETNSDRICSKVRAHQWVEKLNASESFKPKESRHLKYLDHAYQGLAAWEAKATTMEKILSLSSHKAIDSQVWFDAAKGVNDVLRGQPDLENAVKSLLEEQPARSGLISDIFVKEDLIFFFREILCEIDRKHARWSERIPAAEIEARDIMVNGTGKKKLHEIIDKIDSYRSLPDGTRTEYTLYEQASMAAAKANLHKFWFDNRTGILSSLNDLAEKSTIPTGKENILAVLKKLKKIFNDNLETKLQNWQNKRESGKDFIDITWYLIKEIKGNKLAVDTLLQGELKPMGIFAGQALDGIITALAENLRADIESGRVSV